MCMLQTFHFVCAACVCLCVLVGTVCVPPSRSLFIQVKQERMKELKGLNVAFATMDPTVRA